MPAGRCRPTAGRGAPVQPESAGGLCYGYGVPEMSPQVDVGHGRVERRQGRLARGGGGRRGEQPSCRPHDSQRVVEADVPRFSPDQQRAAIVAAAPRPFRVRGARAVGAQKRTWMAKAEAGIVEGHDGQTDAARASHLVPGELRAGYDAPVAAETAREAQCIRIERGGQDNTVWESQRRRNYTEGLTPGGCDP